MFTKILIIIIVVLFFIGWNNNPGVNTAVCTAGNEQKRPQLASDGAGGAVIVWEDSRSNSDYDIYGQYLDASGQPKWSKDGVALCTAIGPQRLPQITADGAGGFIITWYDRRNGKNNDIYAQRIDAQGKVQWSGDGAAICTADGDQFDPLPVPDGKGGAIITWQDRRNGNDYDIYGQGIDPDGRVRWITNGVAICSAPEDQEFPQPVPDSNGGAVISWQDRRSGNYYDIYAQRIDANGSTLWTANGIEICTADYDQRGPRSIPDPQGNVIITWMDKRNGSDYDIYAQRINPSGTIQWTANGVAICIEKNSQYDPLPAPDGSGGAIITWQDYRKGSVCNFDAFAQQTDHKPEICDIKQLNEWNIYAQRIDSSGKVRWTTNGVTICSANVDQYKPLPIPDGSGGAIIAWRAADKENDQNLYAQRLDSNGSTKWSKKGVAISTAPGNQFDPQLVPDGQGGAIITWYDNRKGNQANIYAQKIPASGSAGQTP